MIIPQLLCAVNDLIHPTLNKAFRVGRNMHAWRGLIQIVPHQNAPRNSSTRIKLSYNANLTYGTHIIRWIGGCC